MRYINFQLRIQSRGYGNYVTEVTNPQSQNIAKAKATPDPMRITALRTKLAFEPNEELLVLLGSLLFEALFTGEVKDSLQSSIEHAKSENCGLRIQLVIEPNEISSLPWELIYDPESRQFLALSENTLLVRYVILPSSELPPQIIGSPLNILVLLPSPRNMPILNIEHEREVMKTALKPLTSMGLVKLIIRENATVLDMIDALGQNQVHILYYQGHVGYNPDLKISFLLMENEKGHVYRKAMDPLQDTLHRYGVRLAVINSCGMAGGNVAYELVQQGVPAVVATQEPLNDQETAIFLREFHQALATLFPVDVSVAKGRIALREMLGPKGRWASPILVTRIPDASVFMLEG